MIILVRKRTATHNKEWDGFAKNVYLITSRFLKIIGSALLHTYIVTLFEGQICLQILQTSTYIHTIRVY